MQIVGHRWVKSIEFYPIELMGDIAQTPPNSVVKIANLKDNIELIKYCQKNLIPFALEIESIKESIFANIFGAKYAISPKELSKKIMPIAQNYLFDTQIFAYISKEEEIEEMAEVGVDGVILKSEW